MRLTHRMARRMTHRVRAAGAGACVCLVAGHASAQLIYDNGIGGPAGLTSGLNADSSLPQSIADGVAFAADQAVTVVEWTGFYAGLTGGAPFAADSFVVSIRADAAGSPGGVLASFPVGDAVDRALVAPTGGVLSEAYTYRADIAYTFLGGVDYWLQIENTGTGLGGDFWSWGTGPTGTGGNAWFSQDLGTNWFDSGFAGTDFRLFVPAPGSAMLVGIAGLAAGRRRR